MVTPPAGRKTGSLQGLPKNLNDHYSYSLLIATQSRESRVVHVLTGPKPNFGQLWKYRLLTLFSSGAWVQSKSFSFGDLCIRQEICLHHVATWLVDGQSQGGKPGRIQKSQTEEPKFSSRFIGASEPTTTTKTIASYS